MNHRGRDKKRPIRVGLLGAGYIADWHVGALKRIDGVTIAAVCDRDPSRAEALAHRIGTAIHTTSLDEMMQIGELDSVHVLLPPEHHAPAAQTLLHAGKHVLLEKPMALDEAECDSLIASAASAGVRLGIGHNFLYSRVYENLKGDLLRGLLGPIDHVNIVWNKPLGLLTSGPFDSWLFRDPRNILLEVGPHSFAHMSDLLGRAEIVASRASNPVVLAGGHRFFRRWIIEAEAEGVQAGASLQFSFSPGFAENYIQVRGRVASATVDFERNTYILHQHTKYGTDFDRFLMLRREGSSLRASGRSNFVHYALSKFRLSGQGNAYGESIGRAVESFYDAIARGEIDRRISPELGREVVAHCVRAGQIGRPGGASPQPTVAPAMVAGRTSARCDVLVLGATGFIGKELTRQLTMSKRGVRLLVRDPSRVAEGLNPDFVDVVAGDASRQSDLAGALEGIDHVVHLVRSQSKTWQDYYERDVLLTKRIAEACIEAGVKRLVYSGTIGSYYAGHRSGTIDDSTPLDPKIDRRDNYARAKAASEGVLMELHRTRGLPVVIIRPGIVLGRGGHPHHWGVGMWSWDSVCQFWGDGSNGLPIVLVEDVARAIVGAIDTPAINGEVFNLVGPQCLSARDYVDELERCSGIAVRRIFNPPWKYFVADLGKYFVKVLVRHPGRRLSSYRDWETRTQRAAWDCSNAKQRLGWVPTEDRDEIIHLGIQVPAREFLL